MHCSSLSNKIAPGIFRDDSPITALLAAEVVPGSATTALDPWIVAVNTTLKVPYALGVFGDDSTITAPLVVIGGFNKYHLIVRGLFNNFKAPTITITSSLCSLVIVIVGALKFLNKPLTIR